MIPVYLLILLSFVYYPTSQALTVPLGVADSAVVADPLLHVGEELEYAVSYSVFSIGTIKIQLYDKELQKGREVYKARAIIDSNPDLSWLVDLHIRFYSEMDGDVFSYSWIGDDSSKAGVTYRQIRFVYDSTRAMFVRGKVIGAERRPETIDTVKVLQKCQDGFTLFFLARKHVRQKKQMNIPTFIENKQVNTFINFLNRRMDVEIAAVDYPVEVVEFNGKADYVGVFGLTGGFSGWFSNDEARIPVIARMNVILGSIKVELKSWRRGNWKPPKYPRAR